MFDASAKQGSLLEAPVSAAAASARSASSFSASMGSSFVGAGIFVGAKNIEGSRNFGASASRTFAFANDVQIAPLSPVVGCGCALASKFGPVVPHTFSVLKSSSDTPLILSLNHTAAVARSLTASGRRPRVRSDASRRRRPLNSKRAGGAAGGSRHRGEVSRPANYRTLYYSDGGSSGGGSCSLGKPTWSTSSAAKSSSGTESSNAAHSVKS